MNAPYSNWVERWKSAQAACVRLGGEARELLIMPPASPGAVAQVEEQLGRVLPLSFRTVLLEFASRVEMRWYLPDDIELPAELRDIFCGDCSWNLDQVVEIDRWRQESADVGFTNLDDPQDRFWHDSLALAHVPNGDYLVFDLTIAPDPPVIYLSGEGSDSHGQRLGDNFIDFMERWSLLGCPGSEDWQMMPFLNDPTSGLDPHGENARLWRQWFGLNV